MIKELCLFYVLLSSGLRAAPLTISQTLDLALKNSAALQSSAASAEASLAKVIESDAPYDPVFYAGFTKVDDKTPQVSQISANETELTSYKVGIKKFFSTGTVVDVSLQKNRTDLSYPPSSTPMFQPPINPFYQDQLSLSLRQPLWRNFLSREVKLARDLRSSAARQDRLKANLDRQILLARTEQLYWSLVAVDSQMYYLKEMVLLSKKFARSMENRRKYGRADAVDAANADAQQVAREQQYLNLEMQSFNLRTQLQNILNLPDSSKLIFNEDGFAQENTYLVTKERALQTVAQSRLDLKMLNEQQKPVVTQLKLAKEQAKPAVNAFVSVISSTLEATSSKALSKTTELETPKYSYGLELTWTIGSSKAKGSLLSSKSQLLALERQSDDMLREIKRDLSLAYFQKDMAVKQSEQASRHIQFLSKKRRAEQNKVDQARSDQVAVTGYKLEELAAKMDLIQAKLNGKKAESMVRLSMHAY